MAAQNGHTDVCAHLLVEGAHAYVNRGRYQDEATPLHMAAQNGHGGVAKQLLANGAVPDRPRPVDGRGALFFAAKQVLSTAPAPDQAKGSASSQLCHADRPLTTSAAGSRGRAGRAAGSGC